MKKTLPALILTGVLFASPMIGEAALGDQLLRQGIHHSDVEELQVKLDGVVDLRSAIDGRFGPLTHDAVITFQRQAGITVDGIVGPETVSALRQASGSESSQGTLTQLSQNNEDSFTVVLRQGDRGQQVNRLQSALAETGHYTSGVDGIFGPITASAVRSFQRDQGIQVDGIAGPQTFRALDNPNTQKASASSASQTSGNTSASSRVESLIDDARAQIGTPYVWGGTTPSGFDSSGFIGYVFRENGVNLARTHREYYHQGQSVSTPRRGDVVFFQTYLDAPSHAGIYLGDNTFIHNSSSQGVIITSMDNSYWSPRYIGAKRYIN